MYQLRPFAAAGLQNPRPLPLRAAFLSPLTRSLPAPGAVNCSTSGCRGVCNTSTPSPCIRCAHHLVALHLREPQPDCVLCTSSSRSARSTTTSTGVQRCITGNTCPYAAVSARGFCTRCAHHLDGKHASQPLQACAICNSASSSSMMSPSVASTSSSSSSRPASPTYDGSDDDDDVQVTKVVRSDWRFAQAYEFPGRSKAAPLQFGQHCGRYEILDIKSFDGAVVTATWRPVLMTCAYVNKHHPRLLTRTARDLDAHVCLLKQNDVCLVQPLPTLHHWEAIIRLAPLQMERYLVTANAYSARDRAVLASKLAEFDSLHRLGVNSPGADATNTRRSNRIEDRTLLFPSPAFKSAKEYNAALRCVKEMVEEEEDNDLPDLVLAPASVTCGGCNKEVALPAGCRFNTYYCSACLHAPCCYECGEDAKDGGQAIFNDGPVRHFCERCWDQGWARPVSSQASPSPNLLCDEELASVDLDPVDRVELRLQQRRQRQQELNKQRQEKAREALKHLLSAERTLPLRRSAVQAMTAMGTLPPATTRQQQEQEKADMDAAGEGQDEMEM